MTPPNEQPTSQWEQIHKSLGSEKLLLIEHRGLKEVEMHGHAFLELSYIFGGKAEHTLDRQTAVLAEGDYIIVDYGSRHSYLSVGSTGFDNIDCLFLPELLDPVLKNTRSLRTVLEHYLLHFNLQVLPHNPARMVFHDDTGRIKELLLRIREESTQKKAGSTELMRCYLIEILLLTMRKIEGAQTAYGQDICSFMTAYIAEHYMEDMNLNELAALLNYSVPYVSKRFQNETGESFIRYLQGYRVKQAARLLAQTNRSLSEITEMVGYRDVKFFSALFKRTMGTSPSSYRKQARKRDESAT